MTKLSLAFQNSQERTFPYIKRTVVLLLLVGLLDPMIHIKGIHPALFFVTAFFCLWRQFPSSLTMALLAATYGDIITHGQGIYLLGVLLIFLTTHILVVLMERTSFLIHWAILGVLITLWALLVHIIYPKSPLVQMRGILSLGLSFAFYPLWFSFLRGYVYPKDLV